jgi:hypothetical protein
MNNTYTAGFLGFVAFALMVTGAVLLWKGYAFEGLLTLILGVFKGWFVAFDLVISDYVRKSLSQQERVLETLLSIEHKLPK